MGIDALSNELVAFESLVVAFGTFFVLGGYIWLMILTDRIRDLENKD